MAEVQLPTSQLELDDQNIGMEVDDEVALEINDKIEILKGFESDLSAATYCLHNEDHTLGNALRYMLMKNPSVEFCGYSNPHPSEPKIHLRIQMYDQKSSLTALRDALDNLDQLFQTIGEAYEADLAKDEYERFEEPGLTEEQLRETVKKGEEIRRQQRDEKRAESKAKASVASSLRS